MSGTVSAAQSRLQKLGDWKERATPFILVVAFYFNEDLAATASLTTTLTRTSSCPEGCIPDPSPIP